MSNPNVVLTVSVCLAAACLVPIRWTTVNAHVSDSRTVTPAETPDSVRLSASTSDTDVSATRRSFSQPPVSSELVATLTPGPAPTSVPTVTWEEWASGILGIATDTATSTAQVSSPGLKMTSNFLERLADGKPGLWGSKSFYILLAIVYIGLVSVLAKFAVDLLRNQPEDRS